MKNEKLYPKEKQKGVVFYRNKLASQDMSEDPEDIDAIDIDVDDEVKEVVICYDLIMADSKKSFRMWKVWSLRVMCLKFGFRTVCFQM
ncbi:MAG: hypothetical protein ACLTS6_21250 [Anaerobutyricum sp.]